jgi:hypothetical protein
MNIDVRLPGDIRVVSERNAVYIFKGPDEVGIQKISIREDTVNLGEGRIYTQYRRKQYGTIIRAVIVMEAKKSGFSNVTQISSYLQNTNKTAKRPPSAYIMNKLGFEKYIDPDMYNMEFRNLDLKKPLTFNLKDIIR